MRVAHRTTLEGLGAGVVNYGTRQWTTSAWRPAITIPLPAPAPAPAGPTVTQPTRALTYAEQLAISSARAAAKRAAYAAQQVAAQLEAQRQIDAARAVSDLAMQRAAAERAARAAAERRAEVERQARIPQAPQNGGLLEWEGYYLKTGATMPATVRTTLERQEQLTFYRSVAGKSYGPTEAGSGVSKMITVAYGGGDMPYWADYYYRRASADEIALRIAADYTAEMERRRAVQQQYAQRRDLWVETAAPRPVRTPYLIPGLPMMTPAPERAPLALPSMGARTPTGLPPLIF